MVVHKDKRKRQEERPPIIPNGRFIMPLIEGTYNIGRGATGGHHGKDLSRSDKSAQNVKIIAPFSGTIIDKKHENQSGGYGHCIKIRYTDGKDTYDILLAHMKYLPSFKVGDGFKQGSTLGIMGKTGHVFGAAGGIHLHLEVFKNDKWIDPEHFMKAAMPVSERLAGKLERGETTVAEIKSRNLAERVVDGVLDTAEKTGRGIDSIAGAADSAIRAGIGAVKDIPTLISGPAPAQRPPNYRKTLPPPASPVNPPEKPVKRRSERQPNRDERRTRPDNSDWTRKFSSGQFSR